MKPERHTLLQEEKKAFTKSVLRRYLNHCTRRGSEPSGAGLIEFMLEEDVISDGVVLRTRVRELYPEALYNRNGYSVNAIRDLSKRMGISAEKICAWVSDSGQPIGWLPRHQALEQPQPGANAMRQTSIASEDDIPF